MAGEVSGDHGLSATGCRPPFTPDLPEINWARIVGGYPVLTQCATFDALPPRLSDEDVERIARRVVELLKGTP